MKILVLFYITATVLLKGNNANICDVPDGRDPCVYNNHMKMPYTATRNPSIQYSADTDNYKYCDLFALVHGQWYSTFYNMTNYCVDHRTCGSSDPMYLNGTIPQPADGVVNRTACVRTFEHCCEKTLRLRIKNCHYFMVYCFLDLNPACHSRFCLDTDTNFEKTSTSTTATTTTTRMTSTNIKKGVVECKVKGKHHALEVGLIVMVVYSAIISTVTVYLLWKLCCRHACRKRVGGKIYQQEDGSMANDKISKAGSMVDVKCTKADIFHTIQAVNNPPYNHAEK